MAKSKASETKAAAKTIMDLIPEETPEAVLASVKRQIAMRLNRLRAAGLETAPRTCVTLKEFDQIMAFYSPRYETPSGGLPPGQMIAADRILKSVNMTKAMAEDYGQWLGKEEWFQMNPCQQRALAGVNKNILTAIRYGEYIRAMELKEVLDEKAS